MRILFEWHEDEYMDSKAIIITNEDDLHHLVNGFKGFAESDYSTISSLAVNECIEMGMFGGLRIKRLSENDNG